MRARTGGLQKESGSVVNRIRAQQRKKNEWERRPYARLLSGGAKKQGARLRVDSLKSCRRSRRLRLVVKESWAQGDEGGQCRHSAENEWGVSRRGGSLVARKQESLRCGRWCCHGRQCHGPGADYRGCWWGRDRLGQSSRKYPIKGATRLMTTMGGKTDVGSIGNK